MTNTKQQRPYEICSRCIMDTTVPTIEFDENQECNFCKMHDLMELDFPLGDGNKEKLDAIVAKIKKQGEGQQYDVVCGTSGGRDSTWTLWVATQILGLRPLVVHFDNSWNSAIATQNVYNACRILDLDLETYVVDWEEFRDLQLSFLRASTSDVEVPTDLAIHSILHRYADQEGIKTIFNGHSFRTEGIAPKDWTYIDGRYVSAVQRMFGNMPLKTFPNFSFWDFLKFSYVKRIKVIPILNYFPYDQEKVGEIITENLGWTYYGGHHHESFYTKWIQSYLLPRKFKVDRRRTEYSALARSGYMTRDEALDEVKDIYPYEEELLKYTVEKLKLTKQEFQKIYDTEPKSFRDYPNNYDWLKYMKPFIYIGMRMGLIDRLLYLKFFG